MVTTQGFVAALEPSDLEALTAWGRARRFRRGAMLFHEGEDAGHVLIVRAGRVKVSSFTADGREVVLAVRGPGELLGELSAIDGEPRSASASALEQVDVLSVPAEDFRSFLEMRPRVTVWLMQMLSRKLRDADRKRIEFGAHDTVGRVCHRLVELAERFGEESTRGLRITLPLSQQELAGWTGASREAVSKALHQLRSRGYIETARRGITVLDMPALRRRAM
jgi:CRP/FNR family transcriptional regulator, cyclic AMP receptor protein